MRVLVLGDNGIAHALVWKLFASNGIDHLASMPGNAGAGVLAPVAPDAGELPERVQWAADEEIQLVIPADGALLGHGLADLAAAQAVAVWGAPKRSAFLERSRLWLREFINRHNLPATPGKAFLDQPTAERYLASQTLPVNLWSDYPSEYDGAYDDRTAAMNALGEIFALPLEEGQFRGVVIETPAIGPTVALSALTDGTTLVPLLPTRIYDRLEDGDGGWAAQGMGAHTADGTLLGRIGDFLRQQALEPVFQALYKEQLPWWGILGVDCAITAQGPRLLRIRSGFADPEAQVLLPRMDNDFFAWVAACQNGILDQLPPIRWKGQASVGVSLVHQGYPHSAVTGGRLEGINNLESGVYLFQSNTHSTSSMPYVSVKMIMPNNSALLSSLGTSFTEAVGGAFQSNLQPNQSAAHIFTRGGKIGTLVAIGDSLTEARNRVYANIGTITVPNSLYRHDIASREV